MKRKIVGVAIVPLDTIPTDTAQLFVEEPPPTAVVETNETIFDRRRTNRQVVQDVLRAYTNQPYRPLRAGEFYAAGFLSENERLPWGQVIGATDRRGGEIAAGRAEDSETPL